ncbi:MAG TPA: CARDB domain-containing protein [Thermoanaerobaculia bacterium]|nr:CARDB domain-containing protein [Thermoanaerobaculia bacterium]
MAGETVNLAKLEGIARSFVATQADLLGVDPKSLVLSAGRSQHAADHLWLGRAVCQVAVVVIHRAKHAPEGAPVEGREQRRRITAPAVPTVTAVPGTNLVTLTWPTVGAGFVYDVYRSETGCDSGFAKIANDLTALTYVDSTTNILSTYSYQMIAHATGNEACASAPSACQTVTSLADTDVWSHDKPWDTGLEPDPATASDNMWESEDIWVRNDLLPGGHQDPIEAQTNYVHVHVENGGTNDAYNTLVKVYFSPASSGLSWPTTWTLIGTAVIPSLAAGATTEVVVPWVPNITGHVCLVARLVTAQDSMTNPETTDINYNTRYNNNIVWRNVNVLEMFAGHVVQGPVVVRNVSRETIVTQLTFKDRMDRGVRIGFLKRGEVTVDLGPELMRRWRESGGDGKNVKVVGKDQIRILATDAYIQFKTTPLEEFKVTMNFLDTAAGNADGEDYHVFEIRQDDAGKKAVVGGVTYQIHAPLAK